MSNDPRVIENMDEWAHRIAEKVFAKECVGVPAAVEALACVYRLATLCRDDNTILRPEQLVAILIKETSYVEENGNDLGPAVRDFGSN